MSGLNASCPALDRLKGANQRVAACAVDAPRSSVASSTTARAADLLNPVIRGAFMIRLPVEEPAGIAVAMSFA
jgi:hypothetical protein